MSESEIKEVRFDKYCPSCKYWNDGKEDTRICDDCLEIAFRCGTEVPEKWEKA